MISLFISLSNACECDVEIYGVRTGFRIRISTNGAGLQIAGEADFLNSYSREGSENFEFSSIRTQPQSRLYLHVWIFRAFCRFSADFRWQD